jgi:TolA-binding protein
MRYLLLIALPLATLIAGCSTTGGDTLGSLKNKTVEIKKDAPLKASVSEAIKTYEDLIRNSDDAALNEKSLRRLGDLEMQRIDRLYEDGNVQQVTPESYAKAIDAYQKLLTRYPHYTERDIIIYQLARAYEHSGRTDKAIRALEIYARDYPASKHAEEVGFRLGELLFQEGRYHDAEVAYANIIDRGQYNNRFYEQALFKYAWSIYKQDRCMDSLDPFFSVLDLKLNRNVTPAELEKMDFLSRSDQELVNDSFRAVTLCIAMQGKKDALTDYLRNKPVRVYEFLLYQKLAELYLKQGRAPAAAEVYSSYFERSDWHPYALILHDKAIDIYTNEKSKAEIIEAKKEFVRRYNILSEHLDKTVHNDYYRYLIKSDSESLYKIRSRLKVHLLDIAKYYHARAQQSDSLLDFQKATKWYRLYLKDFPQSGDAPHINFLLADTLYEDKLYDEAAHEYERTAYQYGTHDEAAEAGYAALVAYTEQDKLLTGPDKKSWKQNAIQSALNFAKTFPRDPRVPAVLAKAAHELYEGRQYNDAILAAQTIVNRYPDSDPKIRRTALVVLANTQFEEQNYEVAELFYEELRPLIDKSDPLHKEVEERLAACIYKQAEHFRAHGAISSAIDEFKRLLKTVPDTSIRPTVEFDIATTYIIVDRWKEAAKYLEEFKRKYPDNALVKDADEKLAVAYMRLEDPLRAADALKTIVKNADSPEAKRDALWQAAQLYEKAGDSDQAATTYNAYAEMFPKPLEPAVEALYKTALIHKKAGRDYNYRVQLEKIYDADHDGGDQRTNRTRYLAAQAAFVLAEPHYERYASIKLVEPLRKNMQLKKQLMKQALAAYNKATELNVAEYTTAATYRIADMYADFSRKLMDSTRPKNLDDEEMEQYELMLEEQSFPFEEKAIKLHETNLARMTDDGIYNEWIRKSIAALAKLVPARYAREEAYDIAAKTAR